MHKWVKIKSNKIKQIVEIQVFNGRRHSYFYEEMISSFVDFSAGPIEAISVIAIPIDKFIAEMKADCCDQAGLIFCEMVKDKILQELFF